MKKLLSKLAFKGYCEQFQDPLKYVNFDLALYKTVSIISKSSSTGKIKCDFPSKFKASCYKYLPII